MDEAGSVRIGDGERQATVEALTAHREAGRLDPTEFEDRQVLAAQARTWGEIAPLFADLPEPRPAGMPTGLALLSSSPSVPPQAGATAPGTVDTSGGHGTGLLGSVVPARYRETIMALTPFVATALFFLTDFTWLWFLMIPVMGILLYGPESKDDKRRRREQRDRRR